MKKFFLAFMFVVAASIATYAASITVTTSCGTQYEVKCDTCSTSTFVAIAMALDEADCN